MLKIKSVFAGVGNPIKIIKQLEKPYATLPKVHKDIT